MIAARKLLGDLAIIGATIERAGDRLVLRAGDIAIPGELVIRIREAKAELLDALEPARDDHGAAPDDREANFGERTAIIEYDGGAPRDWAEALARLDQAHPPCDVPPRRWIQFIDDCGRFLDDGWADRAMALGWGPLDLFGCDGVKPYARVDRAGLLWLLNGQRLLALGADSAAISTLSGGKLTYRLCKRTPGCVLAWQLQSIQSE